jgi:nitroreductase
MEDLRPGRDVAEVVGGVIRQRRSTRHFSDRKVSHDDLLRLVEAGIYAPSGHNSQNQRFIILEQFKELEALDRVRFSWPYKSAVKRLMGRDPKGIIRGARAAIVVLSDDSLTSPGSTGEYFIWRDLNVQNSAASIQNILLLATAMGIGNVWISASSKMNFTRLLSSRRWAEALPEYEIPAHYSVHGVVALGYPRGTNADDEPEVFPAGERKHGVVWAPTERGNLDHYLIPRCRRKMKRMKGQLKGWDVVRLQLLDKLARASVSFTQRLDRAISHIEARSRKARRSSR